MMRTQMSDHEILFIGIDVSSERACLCGCDLQCLGKMETKDTSVSVHVLRV